MAKALTIVLLFAAAAFVAASGDNATDATIVASKDKGGFDVTVDVASIHKQVTASLSDLHKQIMEGEKLGKDLSNCTCKEDCKEDKQKFCKVTVVPKEVCEEVEGEEDVIVCDTKCFKADKVVTINVPTVDLSHLGGRRLLEAASKGPIGLSITKGKSGNGTDVTDAAAKKGNGTEICREICKPDKKPTTKEECKEVEDKKFDCEEKVVKKTCLTKCKCGDKEVTVKTVPDITASLTSGAITIPNPLEVKAQAVKSVHAVAQAVAATHA